MVLGAVGEVDSQNGCCLDLGMGMMEEDEWWGTP